LVVGRYFFPFSTGPCCFVYRLRERAALRPAACLLQDTLFPVDLLVHLFDFFAMFVSPVVKRVTE
jgi:hypothetical protein